MALWLFLLSLLHHALHNRFHLWLCGRHKSGKASNLLFSGYWPLWRHFQHIDLRIVNKGNALLVYSSPADHILPKHRISPSFNHMTRVKGNIYSKILSLCASSMMHSASLSDYNVGSQVCQRGCPESTNAARWLFFYYYIFLSVKTCLSALKSGRDQTTESLHSTTLDWPCLQSFRYTRYRTSDMAVFGSYAWQSLPSNLHFVFVFFVIFVMTSNGIAFKLCIYQSTLYL